MLVFTYCSMFYLSINCCTEHFIWVCLFSLYCISTVRSAEDFTTFSPFCPATSGLLQNGSRWTKAKEAPGSPSALTGEGL